MKLSVLIVTLAAGLAPAIASAACYSDHAQMSCADGMIYDSESRSCVPATTS